MRYLFAILIFVLLGAACVSIAPAKDCSREEAIQAETEASTLPNWDSVYKSFSRFAHCDDGAISEGYSETVGRLLANDWKDFERLHALTEGNKEFERFVIKHIDETVPSDYLRKIIKNVRQDCSANSLRLCKLIDDAASR